MASGMAVSGLISGMDTQGVISQLMQAESIPQQALKTKVTKEQGVISAYQALNTRFMSLRTQGEALAKPGTWQAIAVSSSSPSVTAAATSASVTGAVTFDVTAVAAAHSVRTDEVPGLTAPVVTDPAVGVEFFDAGGVSMGKVVPADDSLSSLVTAINAKKDLGVTAAAVQTGDGVYRLQLTATKSGKDSVFTVSGLSVANAELTKGSDASITVGSGTGAYTVTSSSNTFTGVMPGVTFTVSAVQTGVTLTSRRDNAALADKMQAMVDAANGAGSDIDKFTATGAKGAGAGALAGNFQMRQLDQKLASTVNTGLTGGGSLATIGVELDRSGKVTFDRAKFLAAMDTAPEATQTAATEFGQRLGDLGKSVTDTATGTLTLAIKNRDDAVKSLNKQIEAWDTRLELRQQTLQRQFTGMEVALGKMREQSNWLAGQLASLPSYGS